MKQMKTLTLPNGVTYEIVDEYARANAKAVITEEDKAAMVEAVLNQIPEITGGSFVKSDSTITATFPLDDGSTTESVITLDENGLPSKIVTDGVERIFTWEGF